MLVVAIINLLHLRWELAKLGLGVPGGKGSNLGISFTA